MVLAKTIQLPILYFGLHILRVALALISRQGKKKTSSLRSKISEWLSAFLFRKLPSPKLTASSHLKNVFHLWRLGDSYQKPSFSGAFAVSFRGAYKPQVGGFQPLVELFDVKAPGSSSRVRPRLNDPQQWWLFRGWTPDLHFGESTGRCCEQNLIVFWSAVANCATEGLYLSEINPINVFPNINLAIHVEFQGGNNNPKRKSLRNHNLLHQLLSFNGG